ncbi:MAG: uroporphyrinogen-III C-methyltransferase [Chloroflexota bacterium]|nr:uroporphyrinogen-III C-methyltransferase [Chloroflexota bacterium]
MAEAKIGKVYLIGAGPGDPGLLTVRGREVLRQADAVVYDYLVSHAFLREAKAGAELIYVGKSGKKHTMAQEEINAILVRLGQEGKLVARLKGGDPLVFARGGEEAEVLQAAGLPFEIVPGVSSATAVPAYAGIPVTQRDFVSSFTVITGHEDPTRPPDESRLDWNGIASVGGTLIFLMGVGHLDLISSRLIAAGRDANTPIAVVRWGTTWQQQTVTGTLATIAEIAKESEIKPPGVIVVGEVVGLRERLQWWDLPQTRPLLGKRIVVTRARDQASAMLDKLIELGADAIEFPVIKILAPSDYAPMDEAIERLSSYEWIVFTSVNGVDYFMRRLKVLGKDARAFGTAKVCTIGPATAARLEGYNLKADFMPTKYVAESILEELGNMAGKKILLARADVARELLYDGLLAQGALVDQVVAYRQVITGDESPTETTPAELAELLEAGKVDVVTFTSPNTIRNFGKRLAPFSTKSLVELLDKTLVACIGPITAGTARDLGLRVDLEATEFTIDKLVETLVKASAN